MKHFPDDELRELLGGDFELQRIADRLRSVPLKQAPLDPGFRSALRRKLMTAAYDRRETLSRPGLLAGLFTGPRLAFATGAVGLLLIAAIVVSFAGGNLFSPAQVTVTTIGASRPVAVDRPILVSFSQPMNHQSVEQSIQIEPATQVTYQWQGNNLVIQPASGQLAPNIQYHITVAAEARTAQDKKIGQPATVAVNTAPLPVASPSPGPSPTARPQPAITSERNLAAAGTPIAWSTDGVTLYYLAAGDLISIRNDGTGQKTLLTGAVSAAALSPDGAKLLVLQGGKLVLLTLAGGAAEVLGSAAAASGVGFQAGKPIYWTLQPSLSFFSATDQQPIAAVSAPVHSLYLSPDGGKAVLLPNPAVAGGQATLYDLTAKTGKPWAQAPSSNVAWSPDSSRVAFLAAGSVVVGQPDGTAAKPVLGLAEPNAEIAWTPADKLLVVSNSGTWLVSPDGSASTRVRKTPVGSGITWAPSGNRAGLVRDGAIWEVEIGTARGELDLAGAAAFVDQYEQARIKGDLATAGSLLTASGARTAPTPPTTDVVLSRYFVIASQATPDNIHFTVRLIFSKGTNEVRYSDEVLTLVVAGGSLRIDSIVDSAPQDLRRGPTVISVQAQPQPGSLVLTFDSDLKEATVAGNVHVNGDGKPVAATVSYSSRRITVTATLTAGHNYQLVVSTGLVDISGQPLQSVYSYDFVASGGQVAPGD